ncbi:MAG: endonuclease, partial [Bacteroidales bacterium]|nr:endonuclease [Bacteroidales bacterium]
PRGIDVAILYDRGRFRLLEKEFIPADTLRTREIVRARGVMEGDTIDVLATHWPSKLHGSSPSDWRRATVAAILLKKVDSLENAGHQKILIVGDFNDTPDSPIFSLLNSKMVNLSSEAAAQGLGSLRYKGRWELIDQALASKNLAREKIFFKIFSPPFILEADKRYLGQKPFRSHIGPRYNGGVSDHLPIIITW